jgi:hypothetical protein
MQRREAVRLRRLGLVAAFVLLQAASAGCSRRAASPDAAVTNVELDAATLDLGDHAEHPQISEDANKAPMAPVPDTRDAEADRAPDAPPLTPNIVACGTQTCSTNASVCCVGADAAACAGIDAGCAGGIVRFCDDLADCRAPQICCAAPSVGQPRRYQTFCADASGCLARGGVPTCRSQRDCPRGFPSCCPTTIDSMVVNACRAGQCVLP